MSRGTLRITIDPDALPPSRAIAAAARSQALMVLTSRAYRDLVIELESHDAALRHLLRIATNVNRPIGVNLPTADGDSHSLFLAPRGWSDERLRGWVAARHEEIEQAFGTAMVLEAAS